MKRVLFLDVDAAPFIAFEMLALKRRGAEIAVAGTRPIPQSLRAGELADLDPCLVTLSWFGWKALAALGYYARTRPKRTLTTLAVATLSYAREPAYLVKLLATLGWTLSAARWAEIHGVTHLHANWAHLPATSAWIAARLTGLPFSFAGHAGRDLYRTTALLGRKVGDARFVVVCNDAARDQITRLCGPQAAAKVHLCHHGIDLERFGSGSDAEADLVLSVGNLDPAKGFDVMIRALAALRAAGRRLRYRIIGEGPERSRLEALARSLGIESSVELPGRLVGDLLVGAYRKARVFTAPSRILANGGRDGLPNVVVEAMAVGVPVIASDVAAIPELVDHERTGLLVPPEDPAPLAAAVARLLDDARLGERLARAARERVARDFDRSQNQAGYCRLFFAESPEPA